MHACLHIFVARVLHFSAIILSCYTQLFAYQSGYLIDTRCWSSSTLQHTLGLFNKQTQNLRHCYHFIMKNNKLADRFPVVLDKDAAFLLKLFVLLFKNSMFVQSCVCVCA